MITLYGIANCDTVKKARAWLDARGVEYRFHDFRKQGMPAQRLARWLHDLGGQSLLNRNGTTWRRLDEAGRARAADSAGAQALLIAQPALMRRPLVEWGDGGISLGFSAEDWQARLR